MQGRTLEITTTISYGIPSRIFHLSEEQKREVKKIKTWEQDSGERNIMLGGKVVI